MARSPSSLRSGCTRLRGQGAHHCLGMRRGAALRRRSPYHGSRRTPRSDLLLRRRHRDPNVAGHWQSAAIGCTPPLARLDVRRRRQPVARIAQCSAKSPLAFEAIGDFHRQHAGLDVAPDLIRLLHVRKAASRRPQPIEGWLSEAHMAGDDNVGSSAQAPS